MGALREELDREGFVVVPGVVGEDRTDAVVRDIENHFGVDCGDPSTWYGDGIPANGIAHLYHCQSMWDVRQHPDVHAVFAEIYGDEALWVSIDRVGVKPPADPEREGYDFDGFIHWDADVARLDELPYIVQGVIALADTDADMGGFQCVPDLYKDLPRWLERPRWGERGQPDVSGYEVRAIPVRRGDLIVWRDLMPHGNGRNRSDRLRLCQYVTMAPARPQDDEARAARLQTWRENRHGPGHANRAVVLDRHDHDPASPRAHLDGLGRKLLGLDDWA